MLALMLTACFWITESERQGRWDLDGDGVERPRDCDDDDPERSELSVFHIDADGDGFGDPSVAIEACSLPEGAVDDASDCDDDDPARFPGANEICNDVDDDCDRKVDEDLAIVVFYRDADGDGAGDPDERVEACSRPAGYVAVGNDCDDDDDARHPGAPEVCNGVDDDCDDDIDLDDVDLDPADAAQYRDEDDDGWGLDTDTRVSCAVEAGWVTAGGDCDDDDDLVHPSANERCNGEDDDCDLIVDEDAIDAARYYPDDDLDGYGDITRPIDACAPPVGTVANGADCDDDRPWAKPGADELCGNSLDDDCDGAVDEVGCSPADTGGPPDTSDTGATP